VKVHLARGARNDFTQIALVIARANPTQALSIVTELEAVAIRIADTPRWFLVMSSTPSAAARGAVTVFSMLNAATRLSCCGYSDQRRTMTGSWI
jgi:plasmid stabilization system protein ParE